MAVDPADCSLSEAPPCFRYALTQALEGACSDYTPTNWRGFADYFMIKITAMTSTPEEMVTYWIDSHPNRHTHTIKRVKEFAWHSHHIKLHDRMDCLVKAHLVEKYEQKTTSRECLAPCKKCAGWNITEHLGEELTKSRTKPCEHHHVNYNGPVTNHIYNLSSNEELKDWKKFVASTVEHSPTDSPSQRDSIKSNSNNQSDLLQDLGNRLFDNIFPYYHLRTLYTGRTKEAIRIFVIIFLLYQGLSVIIMTLCENGGLSPMFKTNEQNRYNAIVSRLLAFTLRFLLRVVTPFCCTWHIPVIATKPSIPRIGLNREQALPRLFRIHDLFSSEEEVAELRKHPESVFEQSEEMTRRRIKAIWIPMTNAVFTVTLLLYLGAFLACESNTIKGGVCTSLDRTILTLPVLNMKLHLIIIVESLSVLLTLILVAVAANCYYHETTIAKYAVTIGKEAESVHHSVRRRWVLMDWYALVLPYILALVTLLSVSTGQPFTPAPSHEPEAYELVDWYFWIINLTILQYLGFSCNRMTKSASLYGYFLSAVFVYWVQVEVTKVPYGTIFVLLYCGLTAMSFNLLHSLSTCYLCHARETGSLSSYVMCACCVVSQVVLIASLVITLYWEVAHLATYVVHNML